MKIIVAETCTTLRRTSLRVLAQSPSWNRHNARVHVFRFTGLKLRRQTNFDPPFTLRHLSAALPGAANATSNNSPPISHGNSSHITARNTITSTPEELFSVLRSCKNLHEFRISTSWSETARVQTLTTPIVLPNLQHLKIYAEGSSFAPLLSQAMLPALVSLQLYHTSLSCVDAQKPQLCSSRIL